MKLNLGCGNDKKEGYVNVDLFGGDVTHDLNVFPWPLEDNTVDEVLLHNILEHLPDTVGVMKEVYRICKDGALVHIAVPHPRHDDFISDPTHCRPITIRTMQLFSKKHCELAKNDANNPIAIHHNVDFEMVNECHVVEARWMRRLENKEITEEQMMDAIKTFNNVVKQIEMSLKVIK